MHQHRSLIVLDDDRLAYVEHTCACWLPIYGRQGKLDVDRTTEDPTAPRVWDGLGTNPRIDRKTAA